MLKEIQILKHDFPLCKLFNLSFNYLLVGVQHNRLKKNFFPKII